MSLPPTILLATGNAHKILEMRALLARLLPERIELVSLDRNVRLLGELDQVGAHSPQQRQGFYACSVAFAPILSSSAFALNRSSSTIAGFGTMPGYILPQASGSSAAGGFGYDPIFFSSDLGMCVAKAAAAKKNLESHRARALQRLIGLLLSSGD